MTTERPPESSPPTPATQPAPLRRAWRAIDAFYDRIGLRPLGFVVFVGSALLLVFLRLQSAHAPLQAPAVGFALTTEHPSRIETVVVAVHVAPGDLVRAGTPLVSLSPMLAERELRLVRAELARAESLATLELEKDALDHDRYLEELDLEIEKARRDLAEAESEATLGRDIARAAQKQRTTVSERVTARTQPVTDLTGVDFDLELETARAADARRRAAAARKHLERLSTLADAARERSTLQSALHRQLVAEIGLLRTREQDLEEDLVQTTIVAAHDGRVVAVAPPGFAAPPGTSVATLVPEHATEIVAYLPPETSPERIVPGARVAITRPERACGGARGTVLRRGGAVVEAPGQIQSPILRLPVFGLPVHIAVPEDCAIAVGQLLEVELETRLP